MQVHRLLLEGAARPRLLWDVGVVLANDGFAEADGPANAGPPLSAADGTPQDAAECEDIDVVTASQPDAADEQQQQSATARVHPAELPLCQASCAGPFISIAVA